MTQGTVRSDLLGEENSSPETVIGADGKTYPATRPASTCTRRSPAHQIGRAGLSTQAQAGLQATTKWVGEGFPRHLHRNNRNYRNGLRDVDARLFATGPLRDHGYQSSSNQPRGLVVVELDLRPSTMHCAVDVDLCVSHNLRLDHRPVTFTIAVGR